MMQSAKCTHIISSTWLSGSKTQRFLSRKQNRSQVVHPNWIVESVAQGKRLQESNFSVIFHEVSLDSSSWSFFGCLEEEVAIARSRIYHESLQHAEFKTKTDFLLFSLARTNNQFLRF